MCEIIPPPQIQIIPKVFDVSKRRSQMLARFNQQILLYGLTKYAKGKGPPKKIERSYILGRDLLVIFVV